MAVSDKEMARRIEAIRRSMKKEGLQAIIVFSNTELGYKGAVRYISGYHVSTRKEYLVVPLSGDPVLIVPTLGHQYWARSVSWIKDVRSGGETETMVRAVATALRTAGLEKGPVGIVNLKTVLPHYDYELLVKELPEAVFKDCTDLLDSIRMVKSPEEITMIRETADIADSCYERLVEILCPGIDEREVMAEITKLLALRGVEDMLILTAKGPSFPCFISRPGAYTFREGDHYVFSVEISGPSGYWSQIVRALCLGRSSTRYENMFRVGKAALDAGAANLRPGKRVGEIACTVSDEVKKGSFRTGIWSGHGMGMDLGDGLGLFVDNDLELKAGMVITIHPHIMTHDGKEGLLFGDTFVVREGGGQNLSRTACELKCL